jgi:mRNA interferase RelE/StbE
MAWKVEFDPAAIKELEKLDKTIERRIVEFLRDRVANLEDPRQIGGSLQGSRSGLWKYRVGDYRVICSLEHDRLVVLVLQVGHRREVYKR